MGVIIAGSLNLDYVIKLNRFPEPGETITGLDLMTYPGGKGLNQAVAAARAGAKVAMIGNLGNDAAAQVLKNVISSENILSNFVKNVEGPTGAAYIEVDNNSRNRIVVIAGANGTFTSNVDELKNAKNDVSAKVLLAQLEVPIAELIKLFKLAGELSLFRILNPAPADRFDQKILTYVDLIVPNQFEAESITGIAVVDFESAVKSAQEILKAGAKSVIITMGEKGCVYVDNMRQQNFSTFRVNAVDSTAAGDAFCGALAANIDAGSNLDLAITYASSAGALATTKAGAVPSLPTKSQIAELVKSAELKI